MTIYQPRDQFMPFHDRTQRWSCIVAHRRAGKTVGAICDIINAALSTKKQAARYAYIAPFLVQAKDIAWQYLKEYTQEIRKAANESELWVELHNGARIRIYGADNPDRLRGIYLDGVVLDEPADMRADFFPLVIRPLLADRRGWCVWIGTPKGQDRFYQLHRMSLTSPDWFGMVLKASESGLLNDSELSDAKAAMSEEQFRQEFECDFTALSHDNYFFNPDYVRAAVERTNAFRGSDLIIGCDPSQGRADKTCFSYRFGDYIEKIESFEGMDEMACIGYLVQEIKSNPRLKRVILDSTGFGNTILGMLKEQGYGHIVSGVNAASAAQNPNYANMRAEMAGNFRDWLRTENCRIPNDESLLQQISAIRWKYDSKGRTLLVSKDEIKEDIGVSTDYFDAVALAFSIPANTVTMRTAGRPAPDKRMGMF